MILQQAAAEVQDGTAAAEAGQGLA